MDFEKLKKRRDMGFIHEIGMEVLEVREGYARGELRILPKHINPIDSVHGGVLFSMADTLGGIAAVTRGRMVTTVSGNINYLRPAIHCEKLYGETREIKVGKQMGVYEVVITNDTGKTIVIATMTYFYLGEADLDG